MRRIIAMFFLTVLMVVFAVGCGSNITGSEFVGKWVNNDRAAETVEIKRNAENFTITQSTPTIVAKIVNNDEKIIKEYTGILKDGVLTIKTGSETKTVSYIKDGDYLLFEEHKFIRQK